jgi:hypothetical protein
LLTSWFLLEKYGALPRMSAPCYVD